MYLHETRAGAKVAVVLQPGEMRGNAYWTPIHSSLISYAMEDGNRL